MKKLFIIGGMGAGKSTVCKALMDVGLPCIDLDKVGHEVLTLSAVKAELVEAFGVSILDGNEVDRKELAAKAFASSETTQKLNIITAPRIEELYRAKVSELKRAGHAAVVVEYSAFRDRTSSLARDADVILAVVAPLEVRIGRAVAAGFSEANVRRRISQQITDEDRIKVADVVFNNDGTPEELRCKVLTWWKEYDQQEGLV